MPRCRRLVALAERSWLAARAEAMRRPDFDLKQWHTAALSLGPIGLAALADTLAGADLSS